MIRRLSAPRKRPASAAGLSTRLQLEPLENREMLDAALVPVLNYLTFNAYQAAQQGQQLQATAQANLAQFQQSAAAYTAGKGVTTAQINQNVATLKQDANNIQAANAVFQRDMQYFLWGLAADAGNISNSDVDPLLFDAYFLLLGQNQLGSAMQTAAAIGSASAPAAPPSVTSSPPPTAKPPTSSQNSTDPQLATLDLGSLNVNLLGLYVHTDPIQINISAQTGDGDLLGNLLGDVSGLVNVPAVTNVVNTVLSNVVNLLDTGTLSVTGLNTTSGPFGSPHGSTPSTTSVLTLQVAPVTLNLMGAIVTTSPINLTITAKSGQGLVLGNVVAGLANLFDSPPPKLTLSEINGKLGALVNELNAQFPTIPAPQPVTLNSGQFLALEVAPINLNLLGLNLQTSAIQVNGTNYTGNGDLLGNIVTSLLNTVNASTSDLQTFNNDLNDILGKVIGVLNAATLTVNGTVGSLLQPLTSATLVNTSGTPATVPILNLAIASPNGSTPVNVNLLGLDITTSNIQAQLNATTGDGQILGNLLYNLANLLNPNGVAGLLPILTELGL